jgi:hypothetical protein
MTVEIVVPQPRPTSDVPYHHDRAPGQKYLLLDGTVRPGSPMYVALRRVDRVPPGQPRWLDPHAHVCNSFYVFLGDDEDLGGLAGEVQLGGERLEVRSPSAVLIPPLVLHHYWLTSGSGWYLQITLCPTYEASLAEQTLWRETLPTALRGRLGRPAERDGGRLRLVDAELLPEPGVEVDVAEPPLEPPSGYALHVAVSRRAAPASVGLRGGAGLPTPVAVLTDSGGRPLVVRIRPDTGG